MLHLLPHDRVSSSPTSSTDSTASVPLLSQLLLNTCGGHASTQVGCLCAVRLTCPRHGTPLADITLPCMRHREVSQPIRLPENAVPLRNKTRQHRQAVLCDCTHPACMQDSCHCIQVRPAQPCCRSPETRDAGHTHSMRRGPAGTAADACVGWTRPWHAHHLTHSHRRWVWNAAHIPSMRVDPRRHHSTTTTTTIPPNTRALPADPDTHMHACMLVAPLAGAPGVPLTVPTHNRRRHTHAPATASARAATPRHVPYSRPCRPAQRSDERVRRAVAGAVHACDGGPRLRPVQAGRMIRARLRRRPPLHPSALIQAGAEQLRIRGAGGHSIGVDRVAVGGGASCPGAAVALTAASAPHPGPPPRSTPPCAAWQRMLPGNACPASAAVLVIAGRVPPAATGGPRGRAPHRQHCPRQLRGVA